MAGTEDRNAWRDSLRIRTAVPRSQVFDPSPLLAHRGGGGGGGGDDASVPSSPRTPPLPTTVPAWMANTDRERAAIELGLLHNNSDESRDPNSAPADQPMQRPGLSRAGSYQTLSFATGGPSRNGSFVSMPRASALQRSLLLDDELTNRANVTSSTPPDGALPSMHDFFSTSGADADDDEHYVIVDGKVLLDENGKRVVGKSSSAAAARPKSMGPKALSFMSFSRKDRPERSGGSAASTPNDTPTTTPRPSALSGFFSRSRPGSMRLPNKADDDDADDLSRPPTPDTPAVVFKVGARASASIS